MNTVTQATITGTLCLPFLPLQLKALGTAIASKTNVSLKLDIPHKIVNDSLYNVVYTIKGAKDALASFQKDFVHQVDGLFA